MIADLEINVINFHSTTQKQILQMLSWAKIRGEIKPKNNSRLSSISYKKYHQTYIYKVGPKKFSNLFLSELCQISTKFDNFWQTDGKDNRNICCTLTFHLT